MGVFSTAERLADQTPPERNRYVDFLRVVALGVVVIGHWVVIDVQTQNGLPAGASVLGVLPWAHWLTWGFQVIPIFFLIGGYANAVSWRSHRDRNGDWGTWLFRRSLRLLWPTTIFVVAAALATLIAATLGTPVGLLRQAAAAVSIILWFLAAYLGVAALTPLAVSAHERWRLAFPAALTGMVFLIDALRFLADAEVFALLNHALVWGTFHQLGIAWWNGDVAARTRQWALTTTAAAGLIAAVAWGPYPVSMITVPGAEIQNTGPPTLALLFFGMTQIGLVLLLGRPAQHSLRRSGAWKVVVGANLMVMSAFLWHVLPVVIVATLLWTADLDLPQPVGSASWLAFRPVWILMLLIVLIPILFVAARFERPPPALEELSARIQHSSASLTLGLLGVAAGSAGLALIALEGFWTGGAALVQVWGLAGVMGGLALTTAGGSLGRRPAPRA
jgi:surface polysaccharide O-acyltransferase-like enzyme